MCDLITPQFYETLKTVVNGNIEDFEIIIQNPNKKGDGFLGEVKFLILKDKQSDEVYNLVVKQAFRDKRIREACPIHNVFVNEIYFYSQVWTHFNRVQERIPEKCRFQKLPRFYGSILDDNSEKLILENLKVRNFEIHDKKVPLDKAHYEIMMREYGKFHALSFAYKALHREDYDELVKGLLDIYSEFIATEGFQMAIKTVIDVSMESLQPGTDDVVIDKYKPYLDDYVQLFKNSLESDRKYSVVIHGDCWSNNMMFKYDENGKVSDVRFLDFQLSKEGSPCCDLSYCLYSGAPDEVLQELDHYLKVYHNSLSDTLKAFGCDPEKVYPFTVLKEEWKQYCKLGFMMGLRVWKVKCMYEDNIKDLADEVEDAELIKRDGYDKDRYSGICRSLLMHLYENNFL